MKMNEQEGGSQDKEDIPGSGQGVYGYIQTYFWL